MVHADGSLILIGILILKLLFKLSVAQLEFWVNDGRSSDEFVGPGVMKDMLDAPTVVFFVERLRKAGVIQGLCRVTATKDDAPAAI